MNKKLDVVVVPPIPRANDLQRDLSEIDLVGEALQSKIDYWADIATNAITYTNRRQAQVKVDALTEFQREVF